MRLWSIHPKFLDGKGLVALWREGLLARHVLLGQTNGYRHHPQLERFREHRSPVEAIDSYLSCVLDEAAERRYTFDASKINHRAHMRMTVTVGQLKYEWRHLLSKLKQRDSVRYRQLLRAQPEPHPCFRLIEGPIASWERAR